MENVNLSPEERLAGEVENDFLRRQQERKSLERSWQLNMNFVSGKQFCGLDAKGEIAEEGKDFFWQQKLVFNHIAPIVDTRLSKLSRIRPALTVRAASDEESDRHSAELASAILTVVQDSGDLDGVMNRATIWSEVCGTAFYKVIWNSESGSAVGLTEGGKAVHEGNAEVVAVSPFEIYPYSLSIENIDEQPSIIQAKALPVEEIFSMYGVRLAGRDINDFIPVPIVQKADCPQHMPQITEIKQGYELVLERYVRPCADYPGGRLTVVAGGKVLFDGELPYKNGEDGAKAYPFIKQVSLPVAGSFYGASVVERLIPLQRAYNAVKCRKHEFLNRIAMGVLAVEDGSVDADELAEDGLMPGKIISYRQGGKPPEMLTLGSVPSEFGAEEENILNEFAKVAGTGNLSDNVTSFAGITSATGLQLIIEQDDQRLNHSIHIAEHTAYLLSEKVSKEVERRICGHVEAHKAKLTEEK